MFFTLDCRRAGYNGETDLQGGWFGDNVQESVFGLRLMI